MHKRWGAKSAVASARLECPPLRWSPVPPAPERGTSMATIKLDAAMKLSEDRNLRFVSLQFTDIVGQVKSVQVPMHQLEEAVEHGKWFDGSSIEGFARIAESDMFLVPDLDTFVEIPWEPGIGTDGKEMMNALAGFGIHVETAHHEVATGQHEIDFQYADALRTADNAVTFKTTLKAIAASKGLYATFMPKPFYGINGSGMHTHQSFWDDKKGRNAFSDPKDPYGLSDIARSYIAGVLEHARGMIAILAPLVNSYKRLVPGFEAPVYIGWARINRSALIRIPRYTEGRNKSMRAELRFPDPSSNPYLAFAGMLAAALDGIDNNLTPPK